MQPEHTRKIALVTGATGFIGAHLTQRLFEDGWDVHVIVRRESNRAALQAFQTAVTVHEHDGSTEGMMSIVGVAKPSVVFHLASLFLAQHQSRDVGPLIHSNILFGAQLAEAMVVNGAFALVNAGTSWQHYENKPYSPVCLYAATKQAFEDILRYYTEATPLKVLTLKLFDTYGPNDPRPKLFTLLRKTAAEQRSLDMSPGEQLIDLVYVDDVVQAFIMAADELTMNATHKNEEFAVSSQTPIRLQDLVEIYSRIVNKKITVAWGSRPYRPREVMVPWNTGRVLPRWKPMIGIEEGIRRMEAITG